MPWLVKWLPGPHQKILTLTKHVTDFIKTKIREHIENFNPASPRDYIDAFLTEMGEVSGVLCFPFCISNEICQQLFIPVSARRRAVIQFLITAV